MNRAQASTLTEILKAIDKDDDTIERTLELAFEVYYRDLTENIDSKKLQKIEHEFTKKLDRLSWKIENAFRRIHKANLNNLYKPKPTQVATNEKEYLITLVAKMLDMTPQNLNNHLRKRKDIIVREKTPRKRYISESELKKLKKALKISD
jgi:hypothetical protein